jgi:hypothetical protein
MGGGLGCVVRVEGAVAKTSAYDYGIYVSRRYQSRLARFHGRRVTVLVIVDDCEEICCSKTPKN